MRSLSERQEAFIKRNQKKDDLHISIKSLFFPISVAFSCYVVRLNTDATLDTAVKHSQQTVCVYQGPLATRSLLCYILLLVVKYDYLRRDRCVCWDGCLF